LSYVGATGEFTARGRGRAIPVYSASASVTPRPGAEPARADPCASGRGALRLERQTVLPGPGDVPHPRRRGRAGARLMFHQQHAGPGSWAGRGSRPPFRSSPRVTDVCGPPYPECRRAGRSGQEIVAPDGGLAGLPATHGALRPL